MKKKSINGVIIFLIVLFGLIFLAVRAGRISTARHEKKMNAYRVEKANEQKIEDSLQFILTEEIRVEDSIKFIQTEHKIDSLKNKLNVTKDEFTKSVWYEPKNAPKHINSFSYAGLYLGDNDNIRLYINYFGKDWIFFERVYFIIDGETTDIGLKSYDREGTVCHNGVAEVWDNSLYKRKDLIKMLANAEKPVKVRLDGKFSREYTFKVDNFRTVAQLYLLLNE